MFLSEGSLTTKTPYTWDTSLWPSIPPMSGGYPSAYGEVYKKQLWVYVVVNKLAKAIARLPLPVYSRDGQNRERIPEHPMAKLLSAPNPGLSGWDLWIWTSSTLDIYGDAFWLKQRGPRKQIRGLYPLHPASMRRDEGSSLWSFRSNGLELREIPDRDLIHFKTYNPGAQNWGLSPIEPLRSTLENEWHARNATSSFWRNGARPGVALSHPGNISGAAQDRLKAQWDAIAGGSGNTGKSVILEEGMKPEILTLSAEEAQYIGTRKLNREEVCGAYDIPPPVIHILDHATFSNITEQMRSMYRDTMAPRAKGFESVIERDLRAIDFGGEDIYAEFLMDEVLRGDFEQRQDALAKASHMTIAEKRRIENLPFIEGTDRIFLNTATMPLDAIDAQAAALASHTAMNGAPPQLPANVIPLDTARMIAGRLSRQKTLSEIDDRILLADLNGATAAIEGALSAERSAGGSIESLRARILSMARS